MRELDVGAFAVCENDKPVGIVTDRDLAIRWIPTVTEDSPLEHVMTPNVATCRANDTVENAAYCMSDLQIRRLVVVDENGKFAGMLSLDDIARDESEELAGQTLGEVVEER